MGKGGRHRRVRGCRCKAEIIRMEFHGQSPCLDAEVPAYRQTGVTARRRDLLRRQIKLYQLLEPIFRFQIRDTGKMFGIGADQRQPIA